MAYSTYSFLTKILSFFLILLGFASCDDEGEERCEYGVPSAKFKVKAKVVSEGTPIKNIRAILSESGDKYPFPDTAYSNNEGEIDLQAYGFPTNTNFDLILDDIDGKENGSFQSDTVSVHFTNPKFVNGSGWYQGEVLQDIGSVELTPVPKDKE
ncbi:radical SAM-associated putative lipoprotein [Porphyromonadaceae bacterium OttesenSCG-928-L07]|nr:radical SAM-associated putative lipoprotein [Porphyromonadaceae bacterium OttesenSCG-928-L07]MDL2252433.1 radical SAM-associated putative lipoprotein [Odoribacter sp. OttesenSCG-928-J03]